MTVPEILNEGQHVLALSRYQLKSKSVTPTMSKQLQHHSLLLWENSPDASLPTAASLIWLVPRSRKEAKRLLPLLGHSPQERRSVCLHVCVVVSEQPQIINYIFLHLWLLIFFPLHTHNDGIFHFKAFSVKVHWRHLLILEQKVICSAK